MRSYYSHLETAAGDARNSIIPRPVYRSSAIFPVFQQLNLSTRLIFMGYWILKRNIREIACLVTLRSELGQILSRKNFSITETKAYAIEVQKELENAGLTALADFRGSLEVEFFSTAHLFFPYPAVAVNYYGPSFSSVVHTAQRVYNDFEDMQKNSQTAVPESGFNIYADREREPFISFINGPEEVNNGDVKLVFYNHKRETLHYNISCDKLFPYETKILYPARHLDLESFLEGREGAGKIQLPVQWIFPRIVVGNILKATSAMTITHSYYDCTDAASASDYWHKEEPGWHPASLIVPLTIAEEFFTNIYFYPIYSPSNFSIDLEIYNGRGDLLGAKTNFLVVESPGQGYIKIDLKEFFFGLGLTPQAHLAARIIARPLAGSQLPSRVKLGLDLGKGQAALPCNICTNLQPFNPLIEAKTTSFKWGPVLADHPGSSVWIMNSTPHTSYTKDAIVDLTFYRQDDAATLTRQKVIPPHGFAVILPDEEEELEKFFQGKIGWFTAITTNPYTTTYYFSTSAEGLVGGDHGF